MTINSFFERLIRGGIPEEPNMPKNLLQKPSMPNRVLLEIQHFFEDSLFLNIGVCSCMVFRVFHILYYWQDWTDSIFSVFHHLLPSLFFINALPLAIFAGVFLTKGNGLNYFRSWNAGKKLQFSGLAIVTGYITVMLLYILRVRIFIFQFDPNTHFPISSPQINPTYSFFVYFGLSIMAIGFASLLLTYKANASSGKTTETKEKTDIQSKTKKKTVALVLVIMVLAVSLVCLAGVHLKLQGSYDSLSESNQFATEPKAWIVNEQWTDNIGADSKYVNYKGGTLNFGYKTASNVTLLVSIRGI